MQKLIQVAMSMLGIAQTSGVMSSLLEHCADGLLARPSAPARRLATEDHAMTRQLYGCSLRVTGGQRAAPDVPQERRHPAPHLVEVDGRGRTVCGSHAAYPFRACRWSRPERVVAERLQGVRH